jgi:hypothetical protein
MKALGRPTAALAIIPLLGTSACGNLAVPPPFEAAGAWHVEKGDRVVVVLKTGEKVEGKVEAIDDEGFVIGCRRIERTEIEEMSMKRGSVVGAAGGAVLVMGLVLVAALAVIGSQVTFGAD